MINVRAKIKATTIALFNGAKRVVATAINFTTSGNSLDTIDISYPYGSGSVPPAGAYGVFIPVGGSSKKYICIGFVPVIPNIPYTFLSGESWNNSQKYILAMQNDAIKAYRNGDEIFNTTLPNGEAFVQMMLNRINDLEYAFNQINNNYTSLKNTFNSHVHTSAAEGSPTTPPTSTLSQSNLDNTDAMNNDKTYLNDGKALINDQGQNYG